MAEQKRVMRVLTKDDLNAVVEIDAAASKQNRRDYYERKFAAILNPKHEINASLICEIDGKIAGFVMGDIYFGEFGIPESTATIDTIGVDPRFQNHGVASELLDQFMMNMKAGGVSKVYTLVNWDDFALEKFFSRQKFAPSKRINLEYTVV
ncbi:GNAT family N-acetyltransferase [Aromatoleum aromaticum]|uniref:Regulatory protein,conserved in anaerobic benzoate degadation gene clusters n=1 Tax=Aromatoleum aromaticum (strain DSM 19018 / LMG 30748 / EbN1) TaxID=76114 RepID=Q5P0N4_AROAE|nr:GNAT family N-acetyltransferase [Aromatoleum aromaticum]NMG55850.1 GNAT family N-acetyltransferase [Aromatoleum aromaticum]CAI09130.1 putative regulatory protein,conserved in anaerobic benzoate degadation gene clusters [Aromatoleum aromaticum EbN1]